MHAADLKTGYNTQLPYEAYFYLNVLTLTANPTQLLDRLTGKAQAALDRILMRTANLEARWAGHPVSAQIGPVMVYAELLSIAIERVGADTIDAAMRAEWASHPEDLDTRERSVRLVRCLWALSGLTGPAAALYISPPYYPHLPPAPGPLAQAVRGVAAAHPELRLQCMDFFPLLSDMMLGITNREEGRSRKLMSAEQALIGL